jgi:hypothetical protein
LNCSLSKATTLASPDNTKYPTTLAVVNAIPTNNNQLTNGSGYITGNQTISFAPTGDVTGSASGTTTLAPALTIGSNKVTSGMLAQMAQHTYKGNNTGSTANAADITSTQLTADLNLFTSTLQGLVPGSGGGTTNFLRADGTWAAPPAGGGGMTNPMTTQGDIIFENATPAPARLAGPTSSTKQFLTSTGTGAAANNPAWGTIAAGDIPTLNQNTTGTAGSISAANVITNSNLSQMAANTIKGNNTAGTANAMDLTTSQVKTMLAIGESDVTNLTTDLSNKQAITTAATGLTAAGTSTASPLTISSGTDVSNPANGTLSTDFDGYVLKLTSRNSTATAADAERGYVPGIQVVTNSSAVTLTVQTGAQSVFASTMDAVKLSANTTYRFRAVYFGTQTSSTTAHAIRTAFSYSGTLGGTFKYLAIGNVSAIASNTSAQIVYVNTTAATNVTNSTASVTNFQIELEGVLRTSTTGLFTPQIGMSATTGITTFQLDTESFFEIWPVGADTRTIVGSWQ